MNPELGKRKRFVEESLKIMVNSSDHLLSLVSYADTIKAKEKIRELLLVLDNAGRELDRDFPVYMNLIQEEQESLPFESIKKAI